MTNKTSEAFQAYKYFAEKEAVSLINSKDFLGFLEKYQSMEKILEKIAEGEDYKGNLPYATIAKRILRFDPLSND